MEPVETKNFFSKIAFVLSAAIALFIAALFLYNIFGWVNYPDFGVVLRPGTGGRFVEAVTENGCKAGMRVGSLLLTVNGEEITSLEKYRSVLNRGLGEINNYLIEYEGLTHKIAIENVTLGYRRVFSKSGMPFAVGLCYLLIGSLVFLMKPHERVSWIFFISSSIFGLYIIFIFMSGVLKPQWLEKLPIFARIFFPTSLIHLTYNFPQERATIKRHPSAIFGLYIVSAFLFIYICSIAPNVYDIPTPWKIVLIAYMTASVLCFLGSCLQLWLTSPSEIVKIRSKMILIGFAITASVPLADSICVNLFKVRILSNTNLYLPFFVVLPVFLGYSIVKHDLFDFDTIIKRTYGYILTTGSIAGIYGLFVLVSNLAFGDFEFAKSPLFPLIYILAVVFLFNPVRNRAQRIIDRVFYRLEYDYRETIQRISESMRSLLKLDDIAKSIMDTALGVLFIDSGCVILLDQEKQHCECILTAGEREKRQNNSSDECSLPAEIKDGTSEIEKPSAQSSSLGKESRDAVKLSDLEVPLDDPLIQKLSERKREVTIYDIQENPFFEGVREPCLKTFDLLDATLIVPLLYEDRLTGLISLGEKRSGKFYRKEDINLLNTLANQGVVAIENALLLEEMIEKERMEEELAIAHDLQTSMLPAVVPEIKGAEIAAFSVSAREVGGDFYDFIEMGADKLGIVIGDVTGKSVSGALVMSASRSVFRMLSEENLGVGEIMNRANRRTKEDIKPGMFVALLYAVLNADGRSLSLCSAGQTQPILLSSETGDARLIETVGDTFPLGILEDAEYQETHIDLVPGDKIVFYTDGIVEAMNERDEMFGFDRLLEVVKASRSYSAEALMKIITDSVDEFTAGVAQHDDLTLIVLNVVK